MERKLEAQKWLSGQKKGVLGEVKRLNAIQGLSDAEKLTNTQSLSNKKSSLSETLISGEYVKRFKEELQRLGASRIKVEMRKTRTSKGRVYHQIGLVGCEQQVATSDVLSEGEFRIVSLAGFLADVEQGFNNSPIVFDDPISSLDEVFEGATVKRLIDLCNSRQLIVFTHRLSLLALLEHAAEEEGLKKTKGYNVMCLTSEPWGVGEPGKRPIFAQRPEKALNSLLNDDLSRAKKILNNDGRAEYERFAKSICVDFRKLLESFIEKHLLSGVVTRFRRGIQTQQIQDLSVISKADCELFDGLMTRYSTHMHSQPDETPVMIPEPNELQEDLEKVRTWFKDIKQRKKHL